MAVNGYSTSAMNHFIKLTFITTHSKVAVYVQVYEGNWINKDTME